MHIYCKQKRFILDVLNRDESFDGTSIIIKKKQEFNLPSHLLTEL